MYSLLIVDDEQIVLRAMSHIVAQCCPQVEVAGLARSGREAIALALEKKPDIVFMDIELSGLNGLETIQEIKHILPDTVFVIISAYDSFSYAQKGIELGVMDYLLKPVSKQDVLDIVGKAVAKLEKTRSEKRAEISLREKLNQMLPLVEEDFFYALLYSNSFSHSVEEYRRLLEWKSPYGQAVLICAANGEWAVESGLEHRHIIEQAAPKSGRYLISPILGRNVLLLGGFDDKPPAQVWRQTQSNLEATLHVDISVLPGKVYPGFAGLIQSYRELQQSACLDTGDYHPVIKRAKDHIDKNYNQDLSLSEIARVAAVSPNYLSKLFKDSLGETVVDYLTRIRVEKALDMLKNTGLPVKEVAYRVGYADPNYFSKVFKKVTNLTPTAVRKQEELAGGGA